MSIDEMAGHEQYKVASVESAFYSPVSSLEGVGYAPSGLHTGFELGVYVKPKIKFKGYEDIDELPGCYGEGYCD